MSKNCPKCGIELADTAKFCLECGFNIKEYEEKNAYVFCPNCGAKYERGAKFCMECGTKISATTFNSSANTDQSFDGGFDAWGTLNDGLDGWGDTLKKFSEVEEADKLKNFEYIKTPDGEIIVQKYLNEYALNVTVPEGVVVIGNSAFENMGLLSVTLPEGLTTIGKRAFANCKNLEIVNLPQSLLRIDDEAFISCEKLEIKIPNTVKIVGNNTINGTKTEILKQRAEAEAKRKAEEEARRRAEEEARRKAEAEAEAKRKAEEEARKKAEEEARKWQVGGKPTFGLYYQSNSSTKEPIEWEVLAKEGNKALLVSKYALDCKKYNEMYVSVSWETCTLRKWLNDEFINTAFSGEEKEKILATTLINLNSSELGTSGEKNVNDKIFLLNKQEVEKYFSGDSARRCKGTVYVNTKYSRRMFIDPEGEKYDWWLREHMSSATGSKVSSLGYIQGGRHRVDDALTAVRPALWINLES